MIVLFRRFVSFPGADEGAQESGLTICPNITFRLHFSLFVHIPITAFLTPTDESPNLPPMPMFFYRCTFQPELFALVSILVLHR